MQQDLDVPPALPPSSYRLVQPGADGNAVAKAAELIKKAECPVLLVGHAVQCTRAGQKVRELAELMGCPILQTSRSEEHTSELQSLMRISYAVFCLKKKNEPT